MRSNAKVRRLKNTDESILETARGERPEVPYANVNIEQRKKMRSERHRAAEKVYADSKIVLFQQNAKTAKIVSVDGKAVPTTYKSSKCVIL